MRKTNWLVWVRGLFAAGLAIGVGAGGVLLGNCGPFTDVAADVFCPFVLEIFYLGITTGTTATTYDPASNVSRLQMAAFLSRTVDSTLKRGSRRTALDQFWTTQNATVLGMTTLPSGPLLAASDGADLWVSSFGGVAFRIRGSDGRLLETWSGGGGDLYGILPAIGRVFAVSATTPGKLLRIDPSQPAGAMSIVASNLGDTPGGLAFDGSRFWSANGGATGSVSIITPGATIPWTVTTVTTGFQRPFGILYDGANIWVTDNTAGRLLKLDAGGAVLQTVTVGTSPNFPVFDGSNIWIPHSGSAFLSVVRASSGAVIGTPSDNGINNSIAAAFDGQRILTTNLAGGTVSLWKAADLTALGFFPVGAANVPYGTCSDGIQFWVALNNGSGLARF
ncbi:MAG TPA: S-layer homology domain-containing protein [Thermoanaerobaculia bacterium]|nr:S-layer homology domain-containing protein [Thermoanaerobaculia bacterium]